MEKDPDACCHESGPAAAIQARSVKGRTDGDHANMRPRRGDNLLEIDLVERPAKMGGDLTIEELDVFVESDSAQGSRVHRPRHL